MFRVLIIAGFAVAVVAAAPALARGDVWHVVAVTGDVRLEGSAAAVTAGMTLQSDAVIQTTANGRITLAHDGGSIEAGPGTRLRLSHDDSQVKVEEGSTIIHRAGATAETVRAGGSAYVASTSSSVSTATGYSAAADPGGSGAASNRLPSLSDLRALRSPARSAAPSRTNASVAAPSYRSTSNAAPSGMSYQGGLSPHMPSTMGGQAAPTLRYTPSRDVDLPGPAGGSRGGFALGGDGPEMRLAPKSDEQQLQALRSALAEAGAHGVPQLDQRAAEGLLHKIKPKVDADKRWTERPESIAKTAAIGLSLVIVAQLSIMGLLALWRFMRRPKARQIQPRWTTI